MQVSPSICMTQILGLKDNNVKCFLLIRSS